MRWKVWLFIFLTLDYIVCFYKSKEDPRTNLIAVTKVRGFPGGSDGEASARNVGDPSIPGPRRSPGEGNGNPLQYSCLENSLAWYRLQSMGLPMLIDSKKQIKCYLKFFLFISLTWFNKVDLIFSVWLLMTNVFLPTTFC